jgi:hypothetical protein
MKNNRTKVAKAGRRVARKQGKAMRSKRGAAARIGRKSAAQAVAKMPRPVRKPGKKVSAPERPTGQAKQVGEAVGAFLGKTIGRVERIVKSVGKKPSDTSPQS